MTMQTGQQHAMWLGDAAVLNLSMFKPGEQREASQ